MNKNTKQKNSSSLGIWRVVLSSCERRQLQWIVSETPWKWLLSCQSLRNNASVISACIIITLIEISFWAVEEATFIFKSPFLICWILDWASSFHNESVLISVIVNESVKKLIPAAGPSMYAVICVIGWPRSKERYRHSLNHEAMHIVRWSLGHLAHEVVFIFFSFLTGVFKSSDFNSFQNETSLTHIWKLVIFILQQVGHLSSSPVYSLTKVQTIFIFVFKLKKPALNLPENPQGAPFSNYGIARVLRLILTVTLLNYLIHRVP